MNNFISKFLDIAICLTLYYFSLLALVFFSIFPEGRTWGLNVWAYHPLFFQVAVFVVGALAPLMFLSVRAKRAEQTPTNTHPRDISRKLVIIALTGVSAAGFYLLRGTTHFLGDGYTLLSELASDLPLIKGREIGESLLHIWLKNALPGSPGEAALGSFQVISIFSGVGFVLIVAYLSHRLTNQITKGILLSLGLLSGGYMLLFFGYVENYSMFLLSVTVFCLTGILAARSLISWRWALLALGAASLLHVLGLTM
ncbi:MAG: hypothetical protein ACE5GA_10570, partial [Candidatus Zixiibacteriota bacterium]